MSSLRDRKKETRKNRIFETALTLFAEFGYEKTTMIKIAEKADMGVGTLYNYFPSKVELLFSIITAGSDKYLNELDDVINTHKCLKDSLIEFHKIYLKSFSTYGKRIWCELFGEALFRQPDCLKMIDMIDKQYCDKLTALLKLCKNIGEINENTNHSAAVSALYSLLAYNIMRYVSDVAMTELELQEVLKAQSELIVDALLK